MNPRWRLAASLAILLPILGCTDGQVRVGGVVTFDKQPLSEGLIHFAPMDGAKGTQAAHIKDGKYQTVLHRVDYRVRITASKPGKTPPKLDPSGLAVEPVLEELLPSRYNAESKLTLLVTGAKDDANFDLDSK